MSDRPQQMHALSPLGVVTIVMTLLGWSSVPLFLKHFSNSMDAWSANGWRYGFSALLWLPTILVGLKLRSLPNGIWRAAIVPSLFNITGQVTFAWAPYFIAPGLMTFGLRTQILFVAAGAYMLFPSERRILRSPVFLAALAVVFTGAMGTLLLARLHAAGDPHAAEAAQQALPVIFGSQLTQVQCTVIGTILSVGSGALFAGYALSVRHYMHGMNPVKAFAAICQFTGLGLVTLMLLLARDKATGLADHGLSVLYLGADNLLLLGLSAIVGIALGHVFYYTSIARLGVAVSSGVVQLQPILVSLASYYMFSEVLSTPQWACGTIAVIGAIVMLTVQHQLGKQDQASIAPPPLPAGEVAESARPEGASGLP